MSKDSASEQQLENLAAAVRRLEAEKRRAEEWVSTLERTVAAHERAGRESRAMFSAELASVSAELASVSEQLASVEVRLARTLRSRSFRIGHLLVSVVVLPLKAARSLRRRFRVVALRFYRIAQRRFPSRLMDPVQGLATRGQVAAVRRYEVLDLPGDRPVSFVDCRGMDAEDLEATWARIAKSDQPVRTVVLTDEPDFSELRNIGLSFEYIPSYRPNLPWWTDEADYARWVERRMTAIRLGYGSDDESAAVRARATPDPRS